MMAVGVYSFARNLEDATVNWVHDKASDTGFIKNIDEEKPRKWVSENLRPLVRPYMLTTSQWQRWNLFSPDPLRRVSSYGFEALIRDEWVEFHTITPTGVPWNQRAFLLKIMRRLEQDDRNDPILERLTKLYCTQKGIEPGTPVRMKRSYYVIPRRDLSSPSWWRSWEPNITTSIHLSTVCTDPNQ